jgi:hypothetical protein
VSNTGIPDDWQSSSSRHPGARATAAEVDAALDRFFLARTDLLGIVSQVTPSFRNPCSLIFISFGLFMIS